MYVYMSVCSYMQRYNQFSLIQWIVSAATCMCVVLCICMCVRVYIHVCIYMYIQPIPPLVTFSKSSVKAQSSQLKRLFPLKQGKRDVRSLSFEL